MSVAKNIEITSTSDLGFEDAIKKGVSKASESIKGIKGAWVKEQKVVIVDGNVTQYNVTMIVTFVLD